MSRPKITPQIRRHGSSWKFRCAFSSAILRLSRGKIHACSPECIPKSFCQRRFEMCRRLPSAHGLAFLDCGGSTPLCHRAPTCIHDGSQTNHPALCTDFRTKRQCRLYSTDAECFSEGLTLAYVFWFTQAGRTEYRQCRPIPDKHWPQPHAPALIE